jgi:glycosyltransferase involved in cell wall biosynthesis
LKLAILGTRGVPARYGGFETMAAELSARLARRGHDVTVYCRPMDGTAGAEELERDGSWNGVERIVLPALGHKYLETVSHTFVSALHAAKRGYDAVLLCNAANAFVIPILRAARIPVAINVDGIERRRRKWNVLGRAVYASGEAFSVSFADAVIADAEVIAAYYREHYGLTPLTIPYGSEFPEESDSDVLARLGLRSRNYILYVSRFEPENNPLEVIEAYESARSAGADLPPLVMVGKGLYAKGLVAELEGRRSEHVLLPGALYGNDYRTLQRNSLLYVQATEVGGTHPALIEAMASGGAVLANGTPENREVGGDAVGYFELRPQETLSLRLREWATDAALRESFRERGRRRAAARYGWEQVTDAYQSLFRRLAGIV